MAIEDMIEEAGQTATVFGILLAIIAVVWILATISLKLLGFVLFIAGLFIVVKLPGMMTYERKNMTTAIISFGIVLAIIGILLLILG